jgi:hypothetical protein
MLSGSVGDRLRDHAKFPRERVLRRCPRCVPVQRPDLRIEEALRETFAASDPIAITIDHPPPKVVPASKVMCDSIVSKLTMSEVRGEAGCRSDCNRAEEGSHNPGGLRVQTSCGPPYKACCPHRRGPTRLADQSRPQLRRV